VSSLLRRRGRGLLGRDRFTVVFEQSQVIRDCFVYFVSGHTTVSYLTAKISGAACVSIRWLACVTLISTFVPFGIDLRGHYFFASMPRGISRPASITPLRTV
jgi:hypothetical protein